MRLLQPLTGFAAFQKCVEHIYPNGGTAWFKFSHDRFFTGEARVTGRFGIWATQGRDTDRKRTEFIADAYAHLAELSQSQPGGVFYIPGQPTDFPLKDYCFASSDIGAEMDDGTTEEQWQRVEWFSAISSLEPGLVISSGGKSAHPHWFLAQPAPIEQATYLKKLLAIALLGDPAVVNPHQPMRIAGFHRQEKAREQTLDFWSNSRYTQEQFLQGLRAVFQARGYVFPGQLSEERWRRIRKVLTDKALTAEVKTDQIREVLAVDEAEFHPKPQQYSHTRDFRYDGERIPLEICLTRDDRDLIARGVGEGSRSASGFKLASNLIATASYLNKEGITYEPEPRRLFDEFCARCSPALCSREGEAIWRSASRGNPKPSLTDEAIENCITAWQVRHNPQSRQSSKPEYQTSFGEPDRDLYAHYLEEERRWQEAEEQEAAKAKNEWFRGFCRKVKHRFFTPKETKQKRQPAKDATRKKILQFSASKSLPQYKDYQGEKEPPLVRYAKGERHAAWLSAKAAGWQFIQDRSAPGLGKSFDAGLLFPNEADVDDDGEKPSSTIWYLAANHTNPTVPTIERMANLMPRHQGMAVDPDKKTPLGNPWLKHSAHDDKKGSETISNCRHADLFSSLANRNYDVHGERVLVSAPGSDKKDNQLNPVCAACSENWHCHKEVGDGYGYKTQRGHTLSERRIRAHLDSIPLPVGENGHNYSHDIAVVEEAGISLRAVKTVATDLGQLAAEWSYVESGCLETFEALREFRLAFNRILQGEASNDPRFGANHEAIASFLPPPPDNIQDLIEEINEALPSVADLLSPPDSVQGLGGDFRRAGDLIRSEMRKEARADFAAKAHGLPTAALLHILKIWAGGPGAMRCNNGVLSLTLPDLRHTETLKSCGFVILLDATVDKAQLASKLGIDPNAILELEQETQPLRNLLVVNVNAAGLGSAEISDTAKQRVLALINHINEKHQTQSPIIALKRDQEWLKELQSGHWFNDSRGSNVFRGEQVMISINTPRINVGAARDEYLCLHGSLDSFDEYYQKLIQVEQMQCVAGRQRAGLEPQKEFIHYSIGTNQDLDFLAEEYGCTVKNVEAIELCIEAATRGQQSRLRIVQAATELLDAGSKLTQVAIAELTDMSQAAISKIASRFGSWKTLKKILLSLIGANRVGYIFGREKDGPPPGLSDLSEEERLWATEFLPGVAESLAGADLADAVAEVSQVYDGQTVERILHFTPHWVKVKLLVAVLCILPKWARDEFLSSTNVTTLTAYPDGQAGASREVSI